MKLGHPYRAIAVCGAVLFAVVSSMATRLCAQEAAAPRHTGVPQDWSQHHIVFTRDGLAQHPDLIYREPRILHQVMQRWQALNSGVFHSAASAVTPVNNSGVDRDWHVNLAGRVLRYMFPAKFSFDPAAPPDCINDYVVFGLSAAETAGASGTGVHPNLVAFNNLYVNSTNTGFCSGTAPNVLFAYNITTVTGGKISTSPVLSEDGTQIAFVESVPGTTPEAIFHVLTWTAGQGTLTAAAAPTMTSLTFSPTANSTTSSPWVDYGPDIAYLGSDKGIVYKITGVFKGPSILAGAPWPVTVSNNLHLTAPVLDSGRGMLMVGSANGSLYQININSPATPPIALVVGKKGATTPDIVGPPVVDVTNGVTFVVSANDGTSAVLVEADTASNTQLAKVRIGQGSSVGTPAPALNLYEPALSNDYYSDPSTGLIRLCGTGLNDTTPWQYAFGFTVPGTQPIMNTTASFSEQLLTSTAARCTGWTEFFNPNASAGPTDFFFFGLTQDCTGAGTLGCVVARSSDTVLTTATLNGGPSGIVVDNYTAGQDSSIYLSAALLDTVYKFTQNGLQ